MTDNEKNNEKKAKQIAKKNSQSYGFGLGCDSSIECYESAMEMATWKDDQFTELLNDQRQIMIEKACEWLSKNARLYYSAYATTNKLIDDFKEAMEE